MLKSRVIALLTLVDGQLYRSKRFKADRWYSLDFVGLESVDEILLVDISHNWEKFHGAAIGFASNCFTPLSVGGVHEDAGKVFREIPCEKLVVGFRHLPRVRPISLKYGAQAVTVGITKELDPHDAPVIAEDNGAGELFLQSVERDGSLLGYDLDWIASVCDRVDIPVIAASGCGTWGHMSEAFSAGASGAATSVIHHFTETSMKSFKRNLHEKGCMVRV